MPSLPVPNEPDPIALRIIIIRGQRVLLDADLAGIYGVTTKRLNEQVKRNARRFPEDFAFQLTGNEVNALNRSQNATGSGNIATHVFYPMPSPSMARSRRPMC